MSPVDHAAILKSHTHPWTHLLGPLLVHSRWSTWVAGGLWSFGRHLSTHESRSARIPAYQAVCCSHISERFCRNLEGYSSSHNKIFTADTSACRSILTLASSFRWPTFNLFFVITGPMNCSLPHLNLNFSIFRLRNFASQWSCSLTTEICLALLNFVRFTYAVIRTQL